MDRLIQQALLQQLTPIFDPLFSDYSYGFRPGRSAHQALETARGRVAAGHRWCVITLGDLHVCHCATERREATG